MTETLYMVNLEQKFEAVIEPMLSCGSRLPQALLILDADECDLTR